MDDFNAAAPKQPFVMMTAIASTMPDNNTLDVITATVDIKPPAVMMAVLA